jgi:lipoprotein-anchoring transpeptidase ErfK/SrfK
MRKTGALLAVFVLGCVLGAGALADSGPPAGTTTTTTTDTTGTTTTGTTTTVETTTTTAATTTAATTTTRRAVLADGITIGGVAVGGLPPTAAYAAVREAFNRPLTLVFARHWIHATPAELGAVGFARRAVSTAGHAPPRSAIPLPVSVRPGPLRAYLRHLGRTLNREPVDATLRLLAGRPSVSLEKPGIALQVEPALKAVTAELQKGSRATVHLPGKAISPAVTRRGFGPVIVIHRGLNRLQLYNGMRFLRSFGVATGQTAYPTPLGSFHIVVKWKNPWWYPPASPWAAGEKPTPPGPDNPLGTRWMGLSAPGVGIHGTPNAGSIGYSLSHGCIRMLIPQAEWLFEHVEVGTPVFIVAS